MSEYTSFQAGGVPSGQQAQRYAFQAHLTQEQEAAELLTQEQEAAELLTQEQEAAELREKMVVAETAAKRRGNPGGWGFLNPINVIRGVGDIAISAFSATVDAFASGPTAEEVEFDIVLTAENERRTKDDENLLRFQPQAVLDKYTVFLKLQDGDTYGYVLKEGVKVKAEDSTAKHRQAISAKSYELVSGKEIDDVMLLRVQRDAMAHGKNSAHGHIVEESGGFIGVASVFVDSKKNTQDKLIFGDNREDVEKKIAIERINSKTTNYPKLDFAKTGMCLVNGRFYGYSLEDKSQTALMGPYLSNAEINFDRGVGVPDDLTKEYVQEVLGEALESKRPVLDICISMGNMSYGLVELKDGSKEVVSGEAQGDVSSKENLQRNQVLKLIEDNANGNGVIKFKDRYYAINSTKNDLVSSSSTLGALYKAGRVGFTGKTEHEKLALESLRGETAINNTIVPVKQEGSSAGRTTITGYVGLIETKIENTYEIVAYRNEMDLVRAKLVAMHANGKKAGTDESVVCLNGKVYSTAVEGQYDNEGNVVAKDKVEVIGGVRFTTADALFAHRKNGRDPVRRQPVVEADQSQLAVKTPVVPVRQASIVGFEGRAATMEARSEVRSGLRSLVQEPQSLQPKFVPMQLQPNASSTAGRTADLTGPVFTSPLSSAQPVPTAPLSNPSVVYPQQQTTRANPYAFVQASAPSQPAQQSIQPQFVASQQQTTRANPYAFVQASAPSQPAQQSIQPQFVASQQQTTRANPYAFVQASAPSQPAQQSIQPQFVASQQQTTRANPYAFVQASAPSQPAQQSIQPQFVASQQQTTRANPYAFVQASAPSQPAQQSIQPQFVASQQQTTRANPYAFVQASAPSQPAQQSIQPHFVAPQQQTTRANPYAFVQASAPSQPAQQSIQPHFVAPQRQPQFVSPQQQQAATSTSRNSYEAYFQGGSK